MNKPNILLVQLEFASWSQAKPWSYTGGLAIEDGLLANGAECVTVPALCRAPGVAMPSWVSYAKELMGGQRFDQVWVWLIHYPYSDEFLEWVAACAPVRVGLIMESLRYSEEEYRRFPSLRTRAGVLASQMRYFTHAVTADEGDAEWLNEAGIVQARFGPSAIPIRFLDTDVEPPVHRRGAFYGEAYGERQAWLARPELKELLVHAPPAEAGTDYPRLFDALHWQVEERFRSGWVPDFRALADYTASRRRLREAIFACWLQALKAWSAIVNLPSLLKSYPGRVIEAMAVGRPVISWEVPDRPKTKALFEPDRQILLYPQDRPAVLAEHLTRVIRDEDYARAIAAAARSELLQSHTAERRAWEILAWIQRGSQLPVHPSAEGTATEANNGTMPVQCPDPERAACQHETDQFYTNLFVRHPAWSGPDPNDDERARWAVIERYLKTIVRERRERGTRSRLRMLDIGCGRGWLTKLANAYGRCEGVEPVTEVVEHARRLFPHLTFHVGTAESLLNRGDVTSYDVVIASEVVEHVPDAEKAAFMESLARLIRPGGYLILTTPRAEVRAQWERIAPPNQPVEDWLTEEALSGLFIEHGFHPEARERIFITVPDLTFVEGDGAAVSGTASLPIYQVWLARRVATAVSGERDPSAEAPGAGPLVSVIVPTYNRPAFLQKALESVLAQTYRPIEIIVVNDGGEDVEDVVSLMNRSRPVITYVKHAANRGLAAARNTGLRLARGKYIAYLDDDDRFYPDHLETLVGFLEQSEYRVVYTDAWRVHDVGEGSRDVGRRRDLPYSHDFNANFLLIANYFPVLTVMHERACLDRCGLFDESLTTHEDWDLWIRMSRWEPFAHIKRITAEFSFRTDGSTMTSRLRKDFARTAEIIYEKYRLHAEAVPGIREAQVKRLAELNALDAQLTYCCSIIIPVWNQVELTRQCLQALAETTRGIEYEVIIVDNASTDETPALLAGLRGDVQVIRNQENLGFAQACNQGAKAARGRYLVFLNNDTVPQSGWLEPLVREAEEHADVAVVGSKLLYPNGTVQHAGVAVSRIGLIPYHLYRGFPADAPAVNRRREFQAVTAACMLIRREVFEEVGGFDEGYRNGFEDVDLCLKVRERGGKIVYQPKSVLYHLESQTPGRKTYDEDNSRRLLARWGAHWWLADEDRLAFEDGYRCEYSSPHLVRWCSLRDDTEREAWRYVAEVQQAAVERDNDTVRRLIGQPGRWPADPAVLRWGAMLAKTLNEPMPAGVFWQRLLTLCEDADARLSLARQAILDGRLDEAEDHLGRLPAHAAASGEAWLVRGVLAMQRRAFGDATEAFAVARTLGADRSKALIGLGLATMGAGEFERSWEALVEVLKHEPDHAEALHYLLRVGTALCRWRELAEALGRFIDRNPGDLVARFALAGVLLRGGRIADARREQQILQLLDPQFEGLEDLTRALDAQSACVSSSVPA